MSRFKEKIKEYSVIAGYSLVGASVMTYFSCNSCATDLGKYILTSFFSAIMWATMWIGNGELAHYLSQRFPWMKNPTKRFTWGIVTTVVFTTGVALLLLRMWEYAWQVRFPSYTGFITISLVITFLISLFMHGREFLKEWKQSAIAAERFQRESMTATFESLKNQVNPHFLFNSLNALTNLVYEDRDKAVTFIKQLSEVYRYVLDTRDREVVSLQEELKFLDSYIYLQKIRFGEKLAIDLDLRDIQSNVAPLALQMLFENAIKHNEISQENPLQISVAVNNGWLVVQNTLRERTTSGEHSSGVGLENIKKRYQFLSDKPVIVEKSASAFVVKLPLIAKPV